MSQPPVYNRQYDFSDFQTANPTTPLPADQVDAEYNAVKQTLDATLANLALIQRDDGELANGSVNPETLAAETLALLTAAGGVPRGAWQTGVAYAQKDLVTNSNNTYMCVVAHTSGVLATDIAAGKWLLFAYAQPVTLGTMASQNANAVTISGGNVNGVTIAGAIISSLLSALSIANGGTGAATAAGARTNLGLGALAILSAVTTTEIANAAVTLAKIANAGAANRLLGAGDAGARGSHAWGSGGTTS